MKLQAQKEMCLHIRVSKYLFHFYPAVVSNFGRHGVNVSLEYDC